ncbi:MAG: aminotransferase class V-fold PLP-dependent enzyme, partial [Bacteroidota bacterium]
SPRTKLVAIAHVSNTLGTINPIKEITAQAHAQGATIVVDGSQAPPHLAVDVQDLDCDFFACSAHKMYGPTGIGILYGKRALLEAMPPYQGGGSMIQEVTLQKSTYTTIPYKFEAGTPPIASIVAFKEAIHFIQQIGYLGLEQHEQSLLQHAYALLGNISKVQFIGQADPKVGIVAFTVAGMHHLDVGMLLDAQGIAVRTGHSCTQPLMQRFGVEGVVRASFAAYNTKEEVEKLAAAVARITQRNKASIAVPNMPKQINKN